LPAGNPDGHRAMFLLSGKLGFNGETFNPLSYFVLPDHTDYAAVTAEQDSELLAIGWTIPGRSVPFELF
jgi:hypothetical protein